MNITALTCIAVLLNPALPCRGTSLPLPAIPQTSSLDDNEIIRQYSIYTGLKSIVETQKAIRFHADRSLADPERIRQSVLDHLDKPMDSGKLDEARQRIYKLRKNILLAEEAELDKNFMQENAKRPGVVSLPMGVQYEVIPDPQGNNRRLEEMDCFIRATTIGRQLDKETGKTTLKAENEPNSPPDFSDELPNIQQNTSALQNMPKGSEYIFYVPAELLTSSERRYLDNKNAVIVYIFRQADKEETFGNLLKKQAGTGRIQRMPDAPDQTYEELIGADIARDILRRFQKIDTPDSESELDVKT